MPHQVTRLLYPKARRPAVGWQGGESSSQPFGILVIHIAGSPDHLESAVEGHKCAQQVLLIPKESKIRGPCLGVLEWQENVVHVNEDPIFEVGYDIEEFVVDVTAELRNMAGVDEQDIVGAQLVEDGRRCLLDRQLNAFRQVCALLKKGVPGKRLNRYQLAAVIRVLLCVRPNRQRGHHE